MIGVCQRISGPKFWRYSIGHRSRINGRSTNQPLQLESVAARVLKLLQASSRFLKQHPQPKSVVTEISW